MKYLIPFSFAILFLIACGGEPDTADKMEGKWIPDDECSCFKYCFADSLVIEYGSHRTYIAGALISDVSFLEYSEDETIFYYFDQNVQFMQVTDVTNTSLSIQYLDETSCPAVANYVKAE